MSLGRAFHRSGVRTYNNFVARTTFGLYPRALYPRVHGLYINYCCDSTNATRAYSTNDGPLSSYSMDGPLTVRARNAPIKKRSNPADEIARTKFELLEPIALTDLPRAQQRFVRQINKFNRSRVKRIFAKNKKMIQNGLVGIALVVSIYLYTILVLRKETFLEEIDEELALERGEMSFDDQGRLIAVK